MPEIVHCVRCGRITATGFTGFTSWHVTERGSAVCPNCLTPSETGDDGTSPLTDRADEQLLRDLDPDHGDPPQSST
jgi:hypothetical protein